MKIETLNNYGGTIQDIHDNTIYVSPNQTVIANKSETAKTEFEETVEADEAIISSDNEIVEKGELYFNRAIDSGLMKQTSTGYEWLASQVLLAYFCGKIFCGDYVKESRMDSVWKAGNEAFFPEKALSKLFNRPNIGTSRRKQLEGTPPKGYQTVDKLFI